MKLPLPIDAINDVFEKLVKKAIKRLRRMRFPKQDQELAAEHIIIKDINGKAKQTLVLLRTYSAAENYAETKEDRQIIILYATVHKENLNKINLLKIFTKQHFLKDLQSSLIHEVVHMVQVRKQKRYYDPAENQQKYFNQPKEVQAFINEFIWSCSAIEKERLPWYYYEMLPKQQKRFMKTIWKSRLDTQEQDS